VELPDCDTTVGLLLPPKPRTAAEPKPVEGAGLALAPMATLSKFQVVRTVAAFTTDNEASSIDTMQAIFFVFITLNCGVVYSIKSDGTPICAPCIINYHVTDKCPGRDDWVTK
jgi:hypothetical protein